MEVLVNILIFLIVLFLYIHINHQLKRSEDLEIYEMDYSNNKNLQEVCDIKQPVLFEYKAVFPEFFENLTYDHVSEKGESYDIKVKENSDYWIKDGVDSVDYVVLPLKSSQSLMVSDTKSNYFTENNDDFLDDTGLVKHLQENNTYLKPDFTLNTKYDIMMGSNGAATPLRYHTHFRHFLCVNSGKIHVKMTPWKSSKYLQSIKDYDNYEFRSPINVWKPQKQYENDMEKIKFLEFDVNAGYVLFIPSYWWYSIKFSNEPENLVCGFTYDSFINCITNVPNYALYYLQQSNTHKKVTKTIQNSYNPSTVKESDKEEIIEKEETKETKKEIESSM